MKLNSKSQAGAKADSSTKDEATSVSQHSSKPNVISRFFRDWITKRKIRKFENEYDKYFTGLLLGDLYDAKVKLLTEMKRNKANWMKKYLENKISVHSQIDAYLNGL